MDQVAREDIAASAAAHRELGRDYDRAVAEGLVERIGDEIDKRVDARLRQRADVPMPDVGLPRQQAGLPAQRGGDGQLSTGTRSSREVIALGLGSMAIGGVTSIALLHDTRSPAGLVVVLIWIIIGIINVSYARRR